MDYKKLLDLRNQKRVDEVYNRVKDDDESVEGIYQEIKSKFNSKQHEILGMSDEVLDKVSKVLGIIGMIIFAVLFIIGGAIIVAFVIGMIHRSIDPAPDGSFYNIVQIGMDIFDNYLAGDGAKSAAYLAGEAGHQLSDQSSAPMMFYEIAMTCFVSVFFVILYIISMFRHKKVEEVEEKEIKMNLKECYDYLKVDEDDAFDYIRYIFQTKFKRRHRDFFDKYYYAYIEIFKNYKDVDGDFNSLTNKQKAMLIFRTITNTIKNVLGSFAGPLFFSAILIVIYYQQFNNDEGYTLDLLLSALPFGSMISSLMSTSYSIVIHTPFAGVLTQFSLEFAQVISLCICFGFVAALYNILRYKVIECLRQYKRRLNYYLKVNNGEERKFNKSYLYSISFTIVACVIVIACIVVNINENDSPLNTLENKEEVITYLDIRNELKETLDTYAFEHNQLTQVGESYSKSYVQIDSMSLKNEEAYLKMYTCYDLKGADKLLKSIKGISIKKEKDYQYGLSSKGMIIRYKAIVIVMSNKNKIGDTTKLKESLSNEELNNLKDNLIKKIEV